MNIELYSEEKPERLDGNISITIKRKEKERSIDWKISNCLSEYCEKNNINIIDHT